MLIKLLSKIFGNSLKKEADNYKKHMDDMVQNKLNDFHKIRIENNIKNQDDLVEELKKIAIRGYLYNFKTLITDKKEKLLFHLFNDSKISDLNVLPKEIKLIQLYLNNDISFEDENDFLYNSKTKFNENTKVVAITERDFSDTANLEKINEFLQLNKSIELEMNYSLPNFEIIDQYSKIISASAISLNILEYGSSGSKVYEKAYHDVTTTSNYKNQIGGFPYWNSVFLESQYTESFNKLKFLAQYKFPSEYACNNFVGSMYIYFFFDEKKSKIVHFFNPKLQQISSS